METQQLNRILDALVHPARRVILEQLGETSLTAGELARPFGLDLPAISLHLSILERAGLIVRDGDTHWRLYRREQDPLATTPQRREHDYRILANHW